MEDSVIAMVGYSFFRNDRLGKGGGGVGVYVKENLKVRTLVKSGGMFDNKPEYLFLEINSNNLNKLLFSVAYRRPEATFLHQFFSDLSELLPTYNNLIITGDFNSNLLDNESVTKNLKQSIQECALFVVPSDPTNHTRTTTITADTWLDLFIINHKDAMYSYRKSDSPFIVGHDWIELGFKFHKPPTLVKSVKTRSLNILDSDKICKLISSNLTHPSYQSQFETLQVTPVNSLLEHISTSILEAFDTLAPEKIVTFSSRRKPWVTKEIRSLMAEKDRAWKYANHSGNLNDYLLFKQLRSRISNLLDTAKNMYYANELSKASNPKAKWAIFKNMGLSSHSLPSPLLFFDANTLNAHYASVSNRTAPVTYDSFIDIISFELAPFAREAFNFTTISTEEVQMALNQATSKVRGIDNISTDMLRKSAPAILTSLCNLFNASLSQASFPSQWRKTLLMPLCKVKSPTSPAETRPIAKLSEPSKLLERIVHKQLVKYLEKHNLIDPHQSGFRSDHSTHTTLLGVTEDIRQAVDDRQITVLILFDFTKAFDTIPHETLLRKLYNLNLSDQALRWFYSYLSERTQAVVDLEGNTSTWINTHAGVPQGSVLGPLLFTIFLNDLSYVFTEHVKYKIYADDTQVYISFPPALFAQYISIINQNVASVANFANNNGVLLNDRKTKVILLGSEPYVNSIDLENCPKVMLNGVALDYCTEVVNLGLRMSSTLNWDCQIQHICNKVFRALYALKHHRHALSRSLKKSLVESLIFPYFDYACAVYHDLNKKQNLKLHRALNTCVRFVYGFIEYRKRISPYRIGLNWLSVASRREYFIGNMAFQTISKQRPTYLAQQFKTFQSLTLRRLGRRPCEKLYYLKTPRTECKKNSFQIVATNLINELPGEVTFDMKLISSFKAKLFEFLLNRDTKDYNSSLLNNVS